jgi:galactofuranose transport system ATP-binding protein
VSASANGSALLEVEGVSKRYGGIQAVADGNLLVGRAEMIGLVGPNGCGKSTMLNIVSGLVKPNGGSVVFDGQPLPLGQYRRTQARGLVLVAQELALAPVDTVWESVVLGAEPRHMGRINRRRARQIAAEALATLGHELPLNAPVGSLPPVERRLVTIARGAARPEVRLLILDEPTAGLPTEEAARVIAAMKKLIDADRSVILVSHHIEDIVSSCSKVTLMRDGRTYRTLTGPEVNKGGIVRLLLMNSANVPDDKTAAPGSPELGDVVATFSDVRAEFLDGLSLSVRRGEVVGIAGILGSGASEVIQLLSGQRQPREGQVKVGAAQVTPSAPHTALRSGVGFVSGDRANLVIRTMTVSEHVALPALERLRSRLRLVSKSRERRWVEESLGALSVKGKPEAPMTSLSGGNQQRALMARWVGLPVDVLVVDQPTVGVDLAGRAQLLAVVRNLAAERGVVITAEPEELATVCDRVVCLRRGSLAAELTGDAVTEEDILHATS